MLWYGLHATGAEAFKKGLLELIARGMLRLELRTRTRFRWFTREASVLLPGPKVAAIHAASLPLQAIHRLYLSTPCLDPPGVQLKDLLRGSGRWTIKTFGSHVVMPSLMERGLYQFVEGYRFRILPANWFEEAPPGAAARTELEGLMKTADHGCMASVSRDPQQALALLASLGAAILLMDPLLPELHRLSQLVHMDIGNLSAMEFSARGFDFDYLDFDHDELHHLKSLVK